MRYDTIPFVAIEHFESPNVLNEAVVDHPQHYGGDNTYEAIKVIEAWELDFHLGNAVKYICRAGKKAGNSTTVDLEKAIWYLQRKLERMEK